MKDRTGLIHVYTGDGKGKTTAAMGLALRAIGQGFKVYVIQFMKGGAYTGEFITFKSFLPNNEFVQFGRHCIKQTTQLQLYDPEKEKPKKFEFREEIECGECRWCFLNDTKQKEFCKSAFDHAKKAIMNGDHEVVLLDEINVAIQLGFLKVEDVLFVLQNKAPQTEIILTGRNAAPQILAIADLVTHMISVKHYYDNGVKARRGIEY
jgi:cob(I)alamin adenosyltransferase